MFENTLAHPAMIRMIWTVTVVNTAWGSRSLSVEWHTNLSPAFSHSIQSNPGGSFFSARKGLRIKWTPLRQPMFDSCTVRLVCVTPVDIIVIWWEVRVVSMSGKTGLGNFLICHPLHKNGRYMHLQLYWFVYTETRMCTHSGRVRNQMAWPLDWRTEWPWLTLETVTNNLIQLYWNAARMRMASEWRQLRTLSLHRH